MQRTVNVLTNALKSSSVGDKKAVKDILDIIKNPSYKERVIKARTSGKKNPVKLYKVYKFGEYVDANEYEYIKLNTPAVTWAINAPIDTPRKKSEIQDEHVSGFIYYDIDSIELNGHTLEDLYNAITSTSKVYAAWHSFGGDGMGLLVKVNNLTVSNFLYNWEIINKDLHDKISKTLASRELNIKFSFDAVTKDITRINILSYDPDAFLQDDEVYFEYEAEDDIENRYTTYSKKVSNVDSSVSYDEVAGWYCSHIHNKLISLSSSKSENGARLTYFFYQRYFSTCNIFGIEFDDAMSFLIEKCEDEDSLLFNHRSTNEVEKIGNHQYEVYSSQFGSWIDKNEILEDYEIEDINVKLSAPKKDIEILLNAIFKETGNSYNYYSKEKFKTFIIESKMKGIMPHHVVEFLISTRLLTVYSKYVSYVNDIYHSPYYPFGMVGKLKEEEKKNKRIAFYLQKKNEGFDVIEYEPNGYFYEDNYDMPTDSITDWIDIITYYVKEGAGNNVHPSILLSKFGEKFSITDIADYTLAFNYLADKYGYLRGYRVLNKVAVHSEKDIKDIFTLGTTEYISDINLPIYKKRIVWADTNVGKTTSICKNNNTKRIVLVPVIPLLKSIENTYKNADVFYGDRKTVNQNSNLIVCTYKSYKGLCNNMLINGFKLNEWDLHVDEAHYFGSASGKGYMNPELNYILSTMNSYNSITLWSGTWLNINHPIFNMFNIIRVKKPRTKVLTQVRYKNRLRACEELCVKGKLNVVYLQSKRLDQELGKYTKYFKEKGWNENKMLLLNSNVKTEEAFIDVIKEEEINGKYELIFCTSVAAEGLNFNNTEVETLHFASNESPHIMEQMANRFRKTVPAKMYIYTSIDTPHNSSFSGFTQFQVTLAENTKLVLDFINANKNKDILNQLNDNMYLMGDFMNGYQIDYLAIANAAFNSERIYANQNIKYMMSILSEYGWELNPQQIIIEEDVEKNMLNMLKQYRKLKKEEIYNEQCNIFNYIDENETLKEVERGVNESAQQEWRITSNLPDYEVIIRSRILYFSRYMNFDDAKKIVKHWVTNARCSDKIMKMMVKQLQVKKNIALHDSDSVDITNDFYTRLKEYYLLKSSALPSYYESGFITMVNKLNKSNFKTIEEAFDFMSQYVDVVRFADDKGNIKYKVGAVLLQNEVSYQHKKIKAYLKYTMSSGGQFNKFQALKYVNDMRKKTIFGTVLNTHAPLTVETSLELFQRYADITSDRRGNYTIQSLEPLIFEGIELRFKKKDKIKEQNEEFMFEENLAD